MALNPSWFFKPLAMYVLESLEVLSVMEINFTEDVSSPGYPSCSYNTALRDTLSYEKPSKKFRLVGNRKSDARVPSFWCLPASHIQQTSCHLPLPELPSFFYFFTFIFYLDVCI